MNNKLICPKCKSDHVNLLAIGPFNQYMYGCGECGEQWGDVIVDEGSIPKRNSLLEREIVWSGTPSPNVIYNKWYEVEQGDELEYKAVSSPTPSPNERAK